MRQLKIGTILIRAPFSRPERKNLNAREKTDVETYLEND